MATPCVSQGHAMRTIFDQYVHPENRLTHALVASLPEEPALLRSFLRWLDVVPPRGEALYLVEQRLPGETDDRPETSESDTRRLPDAWIYAASGWALLIESKIAAPIDAAQLRGHLAIAERRGFTDVRLLVLSPNAPARALPDRCLHRRWRNLYAWACAEASRSAWATHLIRYMPVAEQRMVTDQYLQEGTLTTFTGVPFGAEVPYTYLEAKRLLRLLMAEVQADTALDALGVDRAHGGRPSITGSAQSSVWDYLPFTFANADERFTRYPHLTLSIQRDRALAQLILPDKLDGAMRRQLLSGGYEAFKAAVARCIEQGRALSNQDTGAVPSFEVLHRHYVTRQRSTLDAYLEFDPRTAFTGYGPIERQEEWLRSAYDAFADKRSNLQIGIGAAFRYGVSTTVSAPEFARSVVAAWCATAPVLDLLRGAASERLSRALQNAPRGLGKRGVQAAGVRSVRAETTLAGPQETHRG
jgi:hypothetical protein